MPDGPTKAEFEAEWKKLLASREVERGNDRCVECVQCERCSESTFCKSSKDLVRCHYCIQCDHCIDSIHCKQSKGLIACNHCVASDRCARSSYLVRSLECSDCTYCFGCVGLSKRDFHILNKPYDRRLYFAITSRLARELGVG